MAEKYHQPSIPQQASEVNYQKHLKQNHLKHMSLHHETIFCNSNNTNIPGKKLYASLTTILVTQLYP